MTRWSHKLKANKSSEYPSRFIFFDTETTQEDIGEGRIEHHLRLGSALYWRRRPDRSKDELVWCYFTTQDEFWDFVEAHCQKRERIFIIAHNLPFDMGIVKGFAVLEHRGFSVQKMIYDHRKNIWKFARNTTSLVFLDNMNYFDMALKKLGEVVGLEKLTMPPMSADDAEWWTYNKRDTEILYYVWRHWLGFLEENDLGAFGLTIASQAFNAFRHRFMKQDVYIHTNKKAVKLERDSYRGGRVECYFIGELPEKDYYTLDVNSMYAFMLRNHSYPSNFISTGKKMSLEWLAKLLGKYAVIAEVVVNTPEACFGIKWNGRLVFPVGEFVATLVKPELEYGLSKGYVKEVKSFSVYEEDSIFQDYVDFFYGKRLEFKSTDNKVYDYICKKMLNSLYGKFGQITDEWKNVGYDETRTFDYWTEWDVPTQTLHTFRCIDHQVEEKVGKNEGFNTLVAIPAHATAYARMYLWELIKSASSGHVFYCDTDSLIVDKEGLHNLESSLNPTELGKLKVESKARKVIIHNLKDYQFGSKNVIKGIPKNATQVSENSYRMYQSLGIASGIRQGNLDKVVWKEVVKELRRNYTKGLVTETGNVEPLKFSI